MPLDCAKSRRFQRHDGVDVESEQLDRRAQFETGLTGTPYATDRRIMSLKLNDNMAFAASPSFSTDKSNLTESCIKGLKINDFMAQDGQLNLTETRPRCWMAQIVQGFPQPSDDFGGQYGGLSGPSRKINIYFPISYLAY